MKRDPLRALTIEELALLAELPRYSSLRLWAAKHGITPIAASRVLKKIERGLGLEIVTRSNLGVSMTAEGEKAAKKAASVVHAANELRDVSQADELANFERTFVFGSRGFLNTAVAGEVSRALSLLDESYGIRFVDLSPEETMDAARAGVLDFSLSLEDVALGKAWEAKNVGAISWGLYARRAHPLLTSTKASDFLRWRLGHHAYWNGKRIVSNDGEVNSLTGSPCTGFGAQTASTALSLCAATDQLAHVPRIAALPWVNAGVIEEIHVPRSKPMWIDVMLSTETSRVPQNVNRAIIGSLKKLLASDVNS
jgi:DNA-binding transcriptional LysR family regulator